MKVSASYPDVVFHNQQHPLDHHGDGPAAGATKSKQELTHREWSGIGSMFNSSLVNSSSDFYGCPGTAEHCQGGFSRVDTCLATPLHDRRRVVKACDKALSNN